MTRVAVAGAQGRMGQLARATVEAAPDLQYVGGLARTRIPAEHLYDNIEPLLKEQRPTVVLDFTPRPVTQRVAECAIAHGARLIVGTSEWNESERASLESSARDRDATVLVVPNFAMGAVLMMRFAEQAAKHFPTVEIAELHRAEKRDKPSGTAAATAERIRAAGGPGHVPIHSMRLQGALAHQSVVFGNLGELLTIRHDSLSRESFSGGILAAVRGVESLPPGMYTGLESVLE